ncbi:MAG: TonB-dependent receptor [Gemmatimonadota bacterium]
MRRIPLLLLLTYGAVTPLAAQAPDPLGRLVRIDVTDTPLATALLQLRHDNTLDLAWRGDQVPALRVTLHRDRVPLRSVLASLLEGTQLTSRMTPGGTVVLVALRDSTSPATLTATGIQQLDQLVVTGSPVKAAPVREQPTAVTVVSRGDLDDAPHRRLSDQLRAFLPGIVIWDRGGVGPAPVLGAVRGVASFTARGPKVYVDGVEVASSELSTLLDGRMVSQIEMIHGPQGAALYGPEALSGVLQIETRTGTIGAPHLTPNGAAVTGQMDRDIDGASVWREGALGVDAGSEHTSFAALGSVTRLGTDVPLTDAWRLQGGGTVRRGTVELELSGRAASYDGTLEQVALTTGALRTRDVPPLDERGLGMRLTHDASARFTQSVVAGVHRISGTREPFRSPILPPRLPLGATNETATRWSARWAGSYDLGGVAVSAGAEVSKRELERSLRGGFETVGISSLYDEGLSSRGLFGQVRGRVGGLTVLAGARQEWISSVGIDAERPWAAMAGASWTVPVGAGQARFRAAWGRALRPPEPGMSQALRAGSIRQEANPALRAEQQSGVEAGAEMHWASGAWLRFTWFNQLADDLLQQVDLRRTEQGARLYQFQNVGAITNRGVEMDGGARLGRFAAAARVNLVSSRVTELSPTYTGEFAVGDTPLEVPRSTGSVALRYEPGHNRFEVGAIWIGPWTGYDWVLVAKVEAGNSAFRDRAREYWLEYDGVFRPFVGVHVPLARGVSFWARAEFGNSVVRDNLTPTVGRTVLIGIER